MEVIDELATDYIDVPIKRGGDQMEEVTGEYRPQDGKQESKGGNHPLKGMSSPAKSKGPSQSNNPWTHTLEESCVPGLIEKAETAQAIAATFNKFLEPVSDSSTEITALISDLFAISSAARELNRILLNRRYHGRKDSVDEDTRIVLLSIEYTFNDIYQFFGDLGKPVYITKKVAYRGVWNSIINHFKDESGDPLIQRLESYRRFLLNLAEIIRG